MGFLDLLLETEGKMPYIIVQSELNDDDYVHVDIYHLEFNFGEDDNYIGRNSYEVAIRICVFSDYNCISLWLRKWFTRDEIEQKFPDFDEIEYYSFDYWLLSKEFREITQRKIKEN